MKKVLKLITALLIIIIIGVIIYLCSFNYKAKDNITSYLNNSEKVKVTKIDEGYFFDGTGTTSAIVFYPGGKVEYTSYAKLMHELAEKGIDTFLIEMPFNLAVFSINKADNIIEQYKYDNWYISGHSLGGAMACNYATKNYDKLTGVITLAAYPTSKLSDKLRYISFSGSEDLVINKTKYNDAKSLWPKKQEEYIIEGGNHANFGNYGKQKGDGNATITRNEQQKFVIDKIYEDILLNN